MKQIALVFAFTASLFLFALTPGANATTTDPLLCIPPQCAFLEHPLYVCLLENGCPNECGYVCATPTPELYQPPNPTVMESSPVPTAALKPGDANGDGKVDGIDYVIWLNNYNRSRSGASSGDFNNNGFVDGIDYVIWLNNYGK